MENIKVIIADDHAAIRKGYVALLKDNIRISVIGEAENGRELLKQIDQKKPNVIILDLRMPEMSGDQALDIISAKYPSIKIIIITYQFTDRMMLHYFRRGAHAYFPKGNDLEFIPEAIVKVVQDGFYVSNSASLCILRDLRTSSDNTICKMALTMQELRIIKLICEEKSNKEIADELSIVVRTVDFHRKNIYVKTNTQTPAGLVKYAILNGIINL